MFELSVPDLYFYPMAKIYSSCTYTIYGLSRTKFDILIISKVNLSLVGNSKPLFICSLMSSLGIKASNLLYLDSHVIGDTILSFSTANPLGVKL